MSRRSAFLIGAFIIAIGVIIFASKNYSDRQTILTAEKTAEARAFLAKDSDFDGLKDWEEELWKTDINAADTDGDGTNDADEIRAGRNPVLPGPDDKLDRETVASKINPEIESDLSRTDKFSRELFAKYIGSSNSSELYADDYFTIFYKNLQAELETKPPSYFSAADLKVVYTENTAIYRDYANAIGAILAKSPEGESLEHELTILDKASNGKPEELTRLDAHIKEYTRIQTGLKDVAVPNTLLITHLTLLNSVAGVREGIEGMQFIIDDPIKAAAMMQRYPDSAEGLSTSLKSLAEFFKGKKLRFGQSEGGYIFTIL